MKLPITFGHWSWDKDTAEEKFVEGPDDNAYDAAIDADGKTVIEYAGCGSHQIKINHDLVTVLSLEPDPVREAAPAMLEALEFYGDGDNHREFIEPDGTSLESLVLRDKGFRARAALAQARGESEVKS